jgi:hypothetical protein
MPRSNENRLAEEARQVTADVIGEDQRYIGTITRSNQNVPAEPATQVVPPATWGQDWFFVGLVSVGLLGLAYVVLKKD